MEIHLSSEMDYPRDYPTPQLRIVVRRIPVKDATYKMRVEVLQQLWCVFNSGPVGFNIHQTTEWRDVPIIEEKESGV